MTSGVLGVAARPACHGGDPNPKAAGIGLHDCELQLQLGSDRGARAEDWISDKC